ncbi:nucleotidyltransferase family protein [Microbacterium sp. NPDC059771]|uniref:nucleotidyltransferase family protein n=1 Tax=Microbacterium sp. NPDC059771 TaxID=3346941 RepID=UPI0036502F7E
MTGEQHAPPAAAASSALPIDAAGRLAHALVAYTAAEAGVRALSLKGPFAAEYGLRDRRPSADADVLVDPAALPALRERLEQRGWHTRAGRMPPTFIDLHSVTLIHDDWPCDIDLHRFFPGFLAAPEVVFELLWQGREVHRAGGAAVLTPSRAGMAAVVALHAARDPHVSKNRRDAESVRTAVATRFTAAEVREFCDIVRGGRAQWVLRELIAEAGLPLTADDATADEKALWLRNQQPAPAKAASLWIREIADAPLRHKVRVLLHALWVPRDDIPRNDPHRRPSRREALAFQRRRWARGFRSLRGYLRRR